MKIIIEPLDELVEQVRPRLSQAVEPLQVAAALESEGLNDKVARERYGHPDVFSLAEAVYARLGRDEPAPPPTELPVAAWRSLVHGPLYAMPAALLPAVTALIGVQWLMPGLVVTTGIGWVLGSVLSRIAYGLVGRGSPGTAARTLRWGLVAGVVLAGGTAMLWDGPASTVVLAVAQLTFQICSGILLFHRREGLLAALMLPATGAGVLYVVTGHPLVALAAVTLGVVSISAVACAAVLLTRPSRPDGPVPLDRDLGVAALYSGLTAAFLLQAEAAYVVARPDLAITGAGLVLGMGVLEWQAHRFDAAVRGVVRQVCYPAEFTAQGHRLLVRGLGGSIAALAVLTAVPVAFTQVSLPGVVMAAAHVVLGGAYFMAFLLANQGRLVELCLAQGAALLLHPGAGLLLPRDVLADVLLFLAAALLLLSVLLALMSHGLRDVWYYR
ncbi:hypothetical protein ACFXJ8_43585 [Nonomuraea sp. NPDC059194]|uniref:hypothetical protein n=1 Tax=Nonomuraea sp. NPDC059194 TaxID=3346764 RepID=UPI0036982AE8